MPTREVALTGIGLVTPLGSTAAETATAWRAGACAAFRPDLALAGTPLEDLRAARIPPFDAAERLGGRRMLKFMSEAALLGCVAAREACRQARLRERFKPERVGLYAGTGLAAASVEEARPMLEASLDDHGRFSCAALGQKGLSAANPLLSFKILANMPPCLISIMEGIKGPNLIFSPWEAQAAEALVEAWHAVADGEVDAALAGAADHAAHPATVVYLKQSGRLNADEHPAPAGAYVVLEGVESAARDGHAALAIIQAIEIREERGAGNPVSNRLGRSFAAEPAVLLALASLVPEGLGNVGAAGDALAPTWERADVSEANAGRGGSRLRIADCGLPLESLPLQSAIDHRQSPTESPSPRTRIRSSRPSPTLGGGQFLGRALVSSLPLGNGRSLRVCLRAPE